MASSSDAPLHDNPPLYYGLELESVSDFGKQLDNARSNGFNFVSVNLCDRKQSIDPETQKPAQAAATYLPFGNQELLMTSMEWHQHANGKVTEWINLDSADGDVRRKSELIYKQELQWATHMGLQTILLPKASYNCDNYARCVYQTLLSVMTCTLLLRVPLCNDDATAEELESPERARERDSWQIWNKFRTLADHHQLLAVALELTPNLPVEEVLCKWLGEPVKYVIIPTTVFLTNKKGFPTLSKKHQEFLIKLFKHKIQVILSGPASHAEGISAYKTYIDWLYETRLPKLTDVEYFEGPYFDYLQAPLQPLQDNLESSTYEIFERDPVKYRNYEEAIRLALIDRCPVSQTFVIMVVGAGRGPLVKCALRAGERAQRKIRVFAVEKNPNAVLTLHNQFKDEPKVTIVDSDMRAWDAPEKCDILVSELLGSFGDNELSPECLDGAQRFIKQGGISIPCEYTSFLAPLSSSKLHNEVKSFNGLSHFETSYVVKIFNGTVLAPCKPCFQFIHPNPNLTKREDPAYPVDNNRYMKMSFTIKEAATIHGFVGYFDCTLYKDVHISIRPETFSEGMFSWFECFFPLRTPVYVEANSTIDVDMWRLIAKHKVWYEWAMSSPVATPIHNPGGRSYWIGL